MGKKTTAAKNKTLGWINDFKQFTLKGNVIDMAVGVIIGASFQKIISSFVDDIVMPLIGLLTGNINFNDRFAILRNPSSLPDSEIVTLEIAKKNSITTFNYGSFVTTLLNFLIMAFVIFLFIRLISKLKSLDPIKKEACVTEVVVVKTCDYCISEIDINATRCPKCTSKLE